MTLLWPAFPLMLPIVPRDLSLRDGPVTADLPSAELPVADLVTQRGSRQPQSAGGLVQGEHLGERDAAPLACVPKVTSGSLSDPAIFMQAAGDDLIFDLSHGHLEGVDGGEVGTLGDKAVADGIHALMARHRVLLRVRCGYTVHLSVYGVKRVLPA